MKKSLLNWATTLAVVGAMALFMLANNLTPEDVLEGNRDLAFPESVIEFFEGRLGQPPGGFPKQLQNRVLRGRKPLRGRPGATLPPADIEATRAELSKRYKQSETNAVDGISFSVLNKESRASD